MSLLQILLKVVLNIVDIFFIMNFNHSFGIILVDCFDFKLTVGAKDKLLIVPKVWVKHWIFLVDTINIQLQLNSVSCDSLLTSLSLVLGFIKNTIILVENRRAYLAFLYQFRLYVIVQLNLPHKRIAIHCHEIHVYVHHVLF
jgi:hypothetical protein